MTACLKSILLPYLKVKQQIEFKILSPIDKKCVILAYDKLVYSLFLCNLLNKCSIQYQLI